MIFNVTGFIEDTVEGLTVMINSCICLWISIYFSPPKPSGLAFGNMIFITYREVWIRIRHMRFYVGCTIIWSNRASRGLVLSGNKKFQLLTSFMPATRYVFPTGHILVVYIRGLHSTYLLYKLRFFWFFIKKNNETNKQ